MIVVQITQTKKTIKNTEKQPHPWDSDCLTVFLLDGFLSVGLIVIRETLFVQQPQ